MWLMPFLHAVFCFGHGAFAVWSCGVLKSSCGVLVLVMGRFEIFMRRFSIRHGALPLCRLRARGVKGGHTAM